MFGRCHIGLVEVLAALFQLQTTGFEQANLKACFREPLCQHQASNSSAYDTKGFTRRNGHRELIKIDMHSGGENTKSSRDILPDFPTWAIFAAEHDGLTAG
jgi:hypothetical protein